MEQAPGNTGTTTEGPNIVWLIVKIAVVILIVFLGIKFFSEKREKNEESFVERKKTKPKRKKKDE
jgi:uncharacterized membrane protein SirB2